MTTPGGPVATASVNIVPSSGNFAQQLQQSIQQALNGVTSAINHMTNNINSSLNNINNTTNNTFNQVANDGDSAAKRVGASFKTMAGTIVTALGTIGGARALMGAIDQASDLNESLNAVRVMMESGGESFIEFGKTAADALGLTQAELNNAVVPMAALLGGAGSEGEMLSGQLQQLATRATDLGSVFNKDVNEVLIALGAAMRGETEPARAFGVMLDAQAIAAKAVAMGLAETEKEVSNAAKVQGAYQLIMDQTIKSQGDFNNTQDSYANLMKRVKATTKEASAAIGTALLPVIQEGLSGLLPVIREFGPKLGEFANAAVEAGGRFATTFQEKIWPQIEPVASAIGNLVGAIIEATPGLLGMAEAIAPVFSPLQMVIPPLIDGVSLLVGALGELGEWMGENSTVIGTVAAAVGGMALGIGAVTLATTAWTAVTGGLVTAFWALNGAMAANPIGLVIGLIAALAAGFVFAWKKSETFRDIVIGAFNKIVEGIGAAIKAIIWFFSGYVDNVLGGFQMVLEGWAHLPDWLGGGKADQAAQAIQGLRNNISAAVNWINGEIDRIVKDIKIEVKVVTVEEFSSTGDIGFNARAAERATGTGEPDRPVAAPRVETEVNLPFNPGAFTADMLPAGSGGGSGGSGGSGGKSAADKAKKEAEARRKAIQKAVKELVADMAKLAKNTSKQTADSIKNTMDALIEDLNKAERDGFIKRAKEVRSRLGQLARDRDTLDRYYKGEYKSLEEMRDVVKQLREEQADYARGVKDSIIATGDVTKSVGARGTSFSLIRNNLRNALREARNFATAIKDLTKRGLDQTSLRQLVEAGPEAGLAAARAIQRGGPQAIGELKKLQADLAATGGGLGTSVAATFFDAGIKAAQGLVKGMEKEMAAITKAMDRIADSLVASIKKKLKIKSPSLVFQGVGENVVGGLVRGINNTQAHATSSIQNLINNSIAVSVNGVADPVAAQRAGVMAGNGVMTALAQRRAAAALAIA